MLIYVKLDGDGDGVVEFSSTNAFLIVEAANGLPTQPLAICSNCGDLSLNIDFINSSDKALSYMTVLLLCFLLSNADDLFYFLLSDGLLTGVLVTFFLLDPIIYCFYLLESRRKLSLINLILFIGCWGRSFGLRLMAYG